MLAHILALIALSVAVAAHKPASKVIAKSIDTVPCDDPKLKP